MTFGVPRQLDNCNEWHTHTEIVVQEYLLAVTHRD